MRNVTLVDVFTHPIAQKYLTRSGVAHAVACAYHAYRLAVRAGVDPDIATKRLCCTISVIMNGIPTGNGIMKIQAKRHSRDKGCRARSQASDPPRRRSESGKRDCFGDFASYGFLFARRGPR